MRLKKWATRILIIYLKNGIIDYELIEKLNPLNDLKESVQNYKNQWLKEFPLNKKRCNIQLLSYIAENKEESKPFLNNIFFFNMGNWRKFTFDNKKYLEEIRVNYKIGKVHELDKYIIELLIYLGFFEEMEEYYLGVYEEYFQNIIKNQFKRRNFSNCIDLNKVKFFEGKEEYHEMMRGNYDVANLELITLYKKCGLSIREMEEQPFFSKGKLRKMKKSYIQLLSDLEKKYIRAKVRKELEEILTLHYENWKIFTIKKKKIQFLLTDENKKMLLKQKEQDSIELLGYKRYSMNLYERIQGYVTINKHLTMERMNS